MTKSSTVMLAAAAAAAALVVVMPASAALVVLSGSLDNLQVVAPVYQTDSNGNVVLDGNGNPIVIGSTSTVNGHPVSTSTATGFATVTIDTVAQTIATDFFWSNLTGNADRAHLHDAPAGVTRLLSPPNDRFFHEVINELLDPQTNMVIGSTVDGGFVACGGTATIDWDPTFVGCAPASGELHDILQLDASRFDPTGQFGFTDFDALLVAFKTEGMFLDIHTELYPGGEIRGQLIFVPEPPTLLLLGAALFGLLAARKHPQSNR